MTLLEKKRKKKYDSVSYLTGSIDANIDHFNKLMGTDDASLEATPEGAGSPDVAGSEGGEGAMGESLIEAKRYVRRYYIRPQNIFCSNKAEILKALIELGNENCSIYTLNNLGDNKDVSKLMNSDIIYYYDDGVLYDKNRVKVMDYDLSIKKEEKRKHLANAKKTGSKEFKDTYSDRMTAATELEESAFNLDFVDVNAYGEILTEAHETNTCCICGEPIEGYGNNPEPFKSEGRCCDSCNLKFVIPTRIAQVKGET